MPDPHPVSIVMPAWGLYAERPLAEALCSLQAQDAAARIVVVDNASVPPIPALAGAELLRSDERLTLGAARNLGLAQITTPYVLFWDADDLMLPGTLARLTQRIAAEPDVVAVAAAILEGDPPVAHRWPRAWAARVSRRPRAFAIANSVWSIFPTTGATIMRTVAVRAAGGFGDADSGEDWVLGATLAFHGRVVFDRAPGRLYRQHIGSIWATHSTPRHLLAHATAVRRRLRANSDVSRTLLPVFAAAQIGSAITLHPLARTARAVRRGALGCRIDA